jgi:hypothetical protein
MTKQYHYEFRIGGNGTVRLSERGEPLEELLDVVKDDVEIEVWNSTDPSYSDDVFDANLVIVELSSYGCENAETKRGFHAHLAIRLDWDTVERLSDFLEFLLDKARLRGERS